MTVLRLDGERRLVGAGPATHAVCEANTELGAKGWLASVRVLEVRAQGAETDLRFYRGKVIEGTKETGKIEYELLRGRGYLAQTVHRGKPAKHPFWVDQDGEVAFCSSEDVLFEWVCSRQGMDFGALRLAAIEHFEEVERADPLPQLAGSEGQVAWARRIRRAFVVACPALRDDALRHTDARWWIDQREDLSRRMGGGRSSR